jgi:RNA-binding protein
MPVTLTPRERAHLKARAHALEPVVHIGHAGITAELTAEVDRALMAHELIKVRIIGADRVERVALGDEVAAKADATVVHRVGKVLILWRPRPPEAADLPSSHG